MDRKIFTERIAAVCGRTVHTFDNGSFAVQKYPNERSIQLSFDYQDWAGVVQMADIVDVPNDRWFIIFEYKTEQFPGHPGCLFHLQENTEIDGPEGIIDHCFSRTLTGCLNALRRLLDER